MKTIKALKENEILKFIDEDLRIECDVPKGVSITVTNGNISIDGSVQENTNIVAIRIPLIDISHNGGRLVADYAMRDDSGRIRLLIKMSTNCSWGDSSEDRIEVGGKVFTLPLVKSVPDLKGKITISGDITDSTTVLAAEAWVKGRPLLTLRANEEADDAILQIILENLLSERNGYDNVQLFSEIIQKHGTGVGSDRFRSALMLAAASGKLNFLKALIASGKENVNFKAPWGDSALTKALDNGHMDCVQVLFDVGATTTFTQEDFIPLKEHARRGNCLEAFDKLLKSREQVTLSAAASQSTAPISEASSSVRVSSAENPPLLLSFSLGVTNANVSNVSNVSEKSTSSKLK